MNDVAYCVDERNPGIIVKNFTYAVVDFHEHLLFCRADVIHTAFVHHVVYNDKRPLLRNPEPRRWRVGNFLANIRHDNVLGFVSKFTVQINKCFFSFGGKVEDAPLVFH